MLKSLPLALCIGAAVVALAPARAQTANVRPFILTNITLDLANGSSQAEYRDVNGRMATFTSAKEIIDGAFIDLDLKIKVPQNKAEQIQKEGEQSFRPEPARCDANNIGPLEMDDGLRYFFDLSLKTQNATERVLGEIYPGNRSTHWTNDVFCEFDASTGNATFRLTGFYYVIHRQGRDSTSVRLRPVSLSPEEIRTYLPRKN